MGSNPILTTRRLRAAFLLNMIRFVVLAMGLVMAASGCQKCEECKLLSPREGQDTSAVKICGHDLKEFKKMAKGTGVLYECLPIKQ